jgi:recombination protein RecA
VVKNKLAPPFRQVEFDIMYGLGISREGSLLDMATDLELIEKAGSWFSYKGERLGQGRDNVKDLLKENEALAMELETAIRIHFGVATPELETPLQAPTAEA